MESCQFRDHVLLPYPVDHCLLQKEGRVQELLQKPTRLQVHQSKQQSSWAIWQEPKQSISYEQEKT